MTDTKIHAKGRGRPRAFDIDHALDTAQGLFHEHGYDAVGVAALSDALGINPPSLYAAFGSKGELFDRVLERYARAALPIDELLTADRDPADALAALLEAAAHIYTADDARKGCLVVESARAGGKAQCGTTALKYREANRARIRDFVGVRAPAMATQIADMVDVTLSGMSASAREGWSAARLLDVAKAASAGIKATLEANVIQDKPIKAVEA